jgi:hypothetical protein
MKKGGKTFFPRQIYRMNESQGIKLRETCQGEMKGLSSEFSLIFISLSCQK